jgi:TATA-box binding protein (TBP) (component of TFIID and TFIIIB)
MVFDLRSGGYHQRRLIAKLLKEARYEPKTFPALLYEMSEPHISFPIFQPADAYAQLRKEDDTSTEITMLQTP